MPNLGRTVPSSLHQMVWLLIVLMRCFIFEMRAAQRRAVSKIKTVTGYFTISTTIWMCAYVSDSDFSQYCYVCQRRVRVVLRLCVCLLATLRSKLHVRLLNGSSWKFCHTCECWQGRVDYILEVISFGIRIQEFFWRFFNIARYGFSTIFRHMDFPQFGSYL